MLLDDDFDFLLPEDLRNDLIQRLKDVTPLYDKSIWCGKPHCDSTIKPILHTIINAFISKKILTFNKNEQLVPYRLEYDLAYGAYNLIAWQPKSKAIIKLSLNKNTHLASSSVSVPAEVSADISTYLDNNQKEIKLEITPTRNSVERCLFLFSTYDKETHINNDDKYVFIIHYYTFDEDDVLVKIKNLGAAATVISPDNIRKHIKSNLQKMQEMYMQE